MQRRKSLDEGELAHLLTNLFYSYTGSEPIGLLNLPVTTIFRQSASLSLDVTALDSIPRKVKRFFSELCINYTDTELSSWIRCVRLNIIHNQVMAKNVVAKYDTRVM